jgi:hypothetical protein
MQPVGIHLFFYCHKHHFSRGQLARVHWQQEHCWEEDIDLQLAEMGHIKHTQKSVSDFMNIINGKLPGIQEIQNQMVLGLGNNPVNPYIIRKLQP